MAIDDLDALKDTIGSGKKRILFDIMPEPTGKGITDFDDAYKVVTDFLDSQGIEYEHGTHSSYLIIHVDQEDAEMIGRLKQISDFTEDVARGFQFIQDPTGNYPSFLPPRDLKPGDVYAT